MSIEATKRRLSAAERRTVLLEAAMRAFLERSYRGATTAEIAAAAGCNEALIYRHVRSKVELFVAVLDRATVLVCEEAERACGDAAGGIARLRALARCKSEAPTARSQDLARLRLVAGTESAEPVIAQALRRHLRVLHDWTAAELRRAREEGDLRPDVDVDVAAWQWSSLVSLTSLRTAGGDPDAARDFGRMAGALLDDWTRP
jgi:AcrR family transcriptional regulator